MSEVFKLVLSSSQLLLSFDMDLLLHVQVVLQYVYIVVQSLIHFVILLNFFRQKDLYILEHLKLGIAIFSFTFLLYLLDSIL